MKRFKSTNGFSLVELMIVIVIIGVLAAVAVPIYSNNVKKAKTSEADATMGVVRQELRIYLGANGTYPDVVALTKPYASAALLGMDSLDFVGKYFAATDYSIESSSAGTYTITCTNALFPTARTLNQAGDFSGGL